MTDPRRDVAERLAEIAGRINEILRWRSDHAESLSRAFRDSGVVVTARDLEEVCVALISTRSPEPSEGREPDADMLARLRSARFEGEDGDLPDRLGVASTILMALDFPGPAGTCAGAAGHIQALRHKLGTPSDSPTEPRSVAPARLPTNAEVERAAGSMADAVEWEGGKKKGMEPPSRYLGWARAILTDFVLRRASDSPEREASEPLAVVKATSKPQRAAMRPCGATFPDVEDHEGIVCSRCWHPTAVHGEPAESEEPFPYWCPRCGSSYGKDFEARDCCGANGADVMEESRRRAAEVKGPAEGEGDECAHRVTETVVRCRQCGDTWPNGTVEVDTCRAFGTSMRTITCGRTWHREHVVSYRLIPNPTDSTSAESEDT